MKVNRETLLHALDVVRPGLSDKEAFIEQSNSFAFMDGKVVTYNDNISISHPVPELKGITAAVEASRLYSLLNKLTADEVDVNIEKESELIVKSSKGSRTKSGLRIQQEIRLPINEDIVKKGEWKPLPKNFIEGMAFVVTACAKDLSRPMLVCVHVNSAGFVEASDAYKIARFELESNLEVGTFLISWRFVTELIKLKNVVEISEGDGWMHFRTEENTIFSCRMSAETFPNSAHLFDVEGEQLILPEVVDEIIDRAMVFAKRKTDFEEEIKISFENKRLKISSSDEIGWFEEEINATYGGSFSFVIAPYLLKTILVHTQRSILGKTKIKFEGSNWAYVALLKKND